MGASCWRTLVTSLPTSRRWLSKQQFGTKLAMGDVTATARMMRSGEEVLAELGAGGRPEFLVEIDLATGDGTITGQMTIVWTLKPNKRAN